MTPGDEFRLLMGIEEMKDYAPELVPSFEAMHELTQFLKPPAWIMEDTMTFQKLVEAELARARAKHPNPIKSLHYYYAVILEEVDEFWDLVKSQKPDKAKVLEELVQIAAMCQRAAEDCQIIETDT